MRQKIHRQLMRRQRFVVVAVLIGISVFMLWARARHLPLPVIIGSSSALVIGVLLVGGYYYKWSWTGLSDYAYPKVDGIEFYHRKTLWDWLQLLIIPIVLAVGGFVFNQVQADREATRAEQRAQADRDLADKRAQTDRDLATDNQREAALQAYIDKMSELLLDGKLRTSERGSEIRSVARTRTLSTLRQLDGTRKGQVLQFLHESQLISSTDAVITLSYADLGNGYLLGASLREANLTLAVLQGANLHRIDLEQANLFGANLRGANLTFADLINSDLRFIDSDNADLSNADLSNADLSNANLTQAMLQGANLTRANLTQANLRGALVTPEQLAQSASLTGATMPDGSIHP